MGENPPNNSNKAQGVEWVAIGRLLFSKALHRLPDFDLAGSRVAQRS